MGIVCDTWYFVGTYRVLFKITPSELAPLDDRSLLRYSVTGSEGATYEYMTRYMDKVSDLVADSIPEANVNLEIVSPSFGGGGSANSGFGRVGLVTPDQRGGPNRNLPTGSIKN
jgi:multidrug efflux pump subunit AcrB